MTSLMERPFCILNFACAIFVVNDVIFKWFIKFYVSVLQIGRDKGII